MNEEAYKTFVEKVQWEILKDGRPLYKIAPSIGIDNCTLQRFLDGKGVQMNTVILIANHFNFKVF